VAGCRKIWPELYTVYAEVKNIIDSKDELKVSSAHLLLCKSKQVAFQNHQDSKEQYTNGKKLKVEVSSVVELSNSKSTMSICGDAEPLMYHKPGAMKVFDADYWHRSGVSYANTIKIAFFWHMNPSVLLDKEGASSDTKPTKEEPKDDEVKVKTEGVPAEAAAEAEEATEAAAAVAVGAVDAAVARTRARGRTWARTRRTRRRLRVTRMRRLRPSMKQRTGSSLRSRPSQARKSLRKAPPRRRPPRRRLRSRRQRERRRRRPRRRRRRRRRRTRTRRTRSRLRMTRRRTLRLLRWERRERRARRHGGWRPIVSQEAACDVM
jgi:hypothetical protein